MIGGHHHDQRRRPPRLVFLDRTSVLRQLTELRTGAGKVKELAMIPGLFNFNLLTKIWRE
jgi:hypothetical protein